MNPGSRMLKLRTLACGSIVAIQVLAFGPMWAACDIDVPMYSSELICPATSPAFAYQGTDQTVNNGSVDILSRDGSIDRVWVSTSWALPSEIRPIGFSVAGLMTSRVAALTGATHAPSM